MESSQTTQLIYVRTGDQIAHIFSKALIGVDVSNHRSRRLGERRKASTEVVEDNDVNSMQAFLIHY